MELHGKEQQRNRIVLNGIERQGLCKARCRNGIVQRSLAMARRGAVCEGKAKHILASARLLNAPQIPASLRQGEA